MASKPIWPTFRGAPLHGPGADSVLMGFRSLPDIIHATLGTHYVCTTKTGGLGRGPRRDGYPCISFERRLMLRRASDGRRCPLYLIGWVGGYERGSILHMGWQFPHERGFDNDELYQGASDTYGAIARIVYAGRPAPAEVRNYF